MNETELYLKFRQELDRIWVPEFLKKNNPRIIKEDDTVVGLMCASPDYIDCIYILPEHRRKGIAKKAILEHWEQNRDYNMRLHIINNNIPALRFWKSVFELDCLGGNEIDTLYQITGVKENAKASKTSSSVSLIDGHIESDRAFWEDTH